MAEGRAFLPELVLTGCRPEPLAAYLKALGVLRLIGSQKDPDVRGFWRGDAFVISSHVISDTPALASFFLEEWRPTPVVAPWNGGSGFYPKDNREAPEAILASKDARLSSYAACILLCRSLVAARNLDERPADDAKFELLAALRSQLPDDAIAWLDAAIVLGDDRALFPPLLGTGGNDGRLDFSNNFQQRVVEVLQARSDDALHSALFDTPISNKFKGVMGQFQPAAGARTNPWDFVLLIEGALTFAGAATRRLEAGSQARLTFPFHARPSGGIGTVTGADEDDSRNEIWLPLWSRPASLREIRRLFAEGRVTVRSGSDVRVAVSALDFARSITALGVDRGIDGFTRMGFHVRNGLAYFATPLGRFATREVSSARILDEIDNWFERVRQKAGGKNVPVQVAVAYRQLERAVFESTHRNVIGPVLLALAEMERALANCLSFSSKAFLYPVPPLSSAWGQSARDGSVEQRLGASLAALPGGRIRIVPIERGGRAFGRADDPTVVFRERPLVDNLHAWLLRADVEAQQRTSSPPPDPRTTSASLADIAAFILGRTDDALIERWFHAFTILDQSVDLRERTEGAMRPPATFALLALVHRRKLSGTVTSEAVLHRTPGALVRICAGDAEGATALAIRRLNGASRPFPLMSLAESVRTARRIGAALAFPLTQSQRAELESMVLPPAESAAPKTSPDEETS